MRSLERFLQIDYICDMMNRIYLSMLAALLFLTFACKKDVLITDSAATITLSADTITFDTIFTTIGSVTRVFKVYNPHNSEIEISSIYLAGGNSSNFRINVDGVKATEVKNVRIPKKDSLYVFVEVTLDPLNQNLPLIVKDSVVFITNGNEQDVKLIAFGQDVHLINAEMIETETWINDKPYLIYDWMGIDSNNVLTIEEGVKIYLHNYSNIIVWGQINVQGTRENPVIFEGDRFDQGYDRSAGRWSSIIILPGSTGNVIDYAIIKNPTVGIQVGHYYYEGTTPELEIKNTVIQNAAAFGIYALNADILAYNTIIADCDVSAVALTMGGKYNFYHCTISNQGAFYWAAGEGFYRGRSGPSVILTNYFDYVTADSTYNVITKYNTNDLIEANFVNSIITGTKYTKNEVFAKEYEEEKFDFNFKFDHCIVKDVVDSVLEQYPGSFTNWMDSVYARFVNDSLLNGDYDFMLDTLSPAKDAGDPSVFATHPFLRYDFNGNRRDDDDAPDLGAMERKED